MSNSPTPDPTHKECSYCKGKCEYDGTLYSCGCHCHHTHKGVEERESFEMVFGKETYRLSNYATLEDYLKQIRETEKAEIIKLIESSWEREDMEENYWRKEFADEIISKIKSL